MFDIESRKCPFGGDCCQTGFCNDCPFFNDENDKCNGCSVNLEPKEEKKDDN